MQFYECGQYLSVFSLITYSRKTTKPIELDFYKKMQIFLFWSKAT